MNELNNKAELWNKCIEQGIFNNVNKNDASRIQPLFETTLQQFNNRMESVEILNNEFIIRIKEEINKLNSFEERQKEYDKLLKSNVPTKIDFSDKLDEPIKNIDSLVEQTQQMRQDVFKTLEQPKQVHENIDWQKVIKTQNDILIKILETQNKILQILNNR
jgi:hypothetical protein